MSESKFIVSHSRGYFNVDEDTLYCTGDGNWGNLERDRMTDDLTDHRPGFIDDRTYGLTTTGKILVVVSLVFIITAAVMYSLLFLFLGIATAYLSWASSRPPELQDFYLLRANITAISYVEGKTRLSIQTSPGVIEDIVVTGVNKRELTLLEDWLNATK